jgi:hypothetical protein
MRRVIRPNPRPFVGACIIFGSLAVIFLVLIGIRTTRWGDAAQVALAFLGIGAAFSLAVIGNRIVVTDDYLDYRLCWVPKGRVYFQDITESVPVTLAQRDWPLNLAIYGRNASRPEMVLLMKPWHKSDVDWLLSLPQLKVQST